MTTIWNYPTRIVFGAGEISRLADELKTLGVSRVLLVSDPGVEKAGLLPRIVDSLAAASVPVSVFTGVSPNPVESDIAAGLAQYATSEAQGIVAVGGGAALDAAKLIAVRSQTEAPWEELDDSRDGARLIPTKLPPVVAVPTTAGTGSEVGRAAVLTVASTQRKTVIFSPAMLPRVALLDPELTRSLPAGVTSATGFDALTHCLEAYCALGDHPMADGIALAGLELCARSLQRAVEEGSDLAARGDMMKAAMMGAVAFQKGLGACHSLAHPLSSECGLHHGLANALCLPAVVRFNEAVIPERLARVAALFPGEGSCADRLTALRTRLALPAALSSVGVRENQLERLADLAIADGCHRENPRPCSRQDLLALYRASF